MAVLGLATVLASSLLDVVSTQRLQRDLAEEKSKPPQHALILSEGFFTNENEVFFFFLGFGPRMRKFGAAFPRANFARTAWSCSLASNSFSHFSYFDTVHLLCGFDSATLQGRK